MKEVGESKFLLFHTIIGKIYVMQSAWELEQSTLTKATGNWLAIDSPDDLFKYGIKQILINSIIPL